VTISEPLPLCTTPPDRDAQPDAATNPAAMNKHKKNLCQKQKVNAIVIYLD
jgi:hypothetical protein